MDHGRRSADGHTRRDSREPGTIDYREARDAFEREYLRQLLEKAEGNMSRNSKISGISRRNLYGKLEKAGLSEEMIRKRW